MRTEERFGCYRHVCNVLDADLNFLLDAVNTLNSLLNTGRSHPVNGVGNGDSIVEELLFGLLSEGGKLGNH